MAWWESITRSIAANLYNMMTDNPELVKRRGYYGGAQKPQLVVQSGKTDDNIIVNLCGLAVDRSVSRLLSGGVEFDYGEGSDVLQEYIDAVYAANHKDIWLNNSAISGGVYGTGYVKIMPDGAIDPYSDAKFPRLVVLNSEYLTINVNDEDSEKVESYVIEYTLTDDDGMGSTSYRETTRHANPEEMDGEAAGTWIVVSEIRKGDVARWQPDPDKPPVQWPYDFPPIIHWKNLPSLNTVYGSSDLDDILGVQDKNNFTMSNLQKMVRLQAHKQPWGRGIGDKDTLNVGPDKLIKLTNPDAELGVLDFTADISGSLAYSHDLRQTIFDLARELDVTSMADKLGTLTNFGLRVLAADSLDKCNTKRMLFGEMLIELNRRLLVLAGIVAVPCDIKWSDPLPRNKAEDLAGDLQLQAAGNVSKQSVTEKYGYDWEVEQERITQEKSTGDNAIGAAILRSFPTIGQ